MAPTLTLVKGLCHRIVALSEEAVLGNTKSVPWLFVSAQPSKPQPSFAGSQSPVQPWWWSSREKALALLKGVSNGQQHALLRG